MNYERSGLLLPERSQPQADDELMRGFLEAHGEVQEVYKDMAVSPERQAAIKLAWHNGENASLRAEHLDQAVIADRLKRLYAWKAELLSRDDLDPDLQQAYRWRINEDIANVRMLEASRNGDMEAFRRYNEFIYGKPDEDIYRGALDTVAHDAEVLLADPDVLPAVANAASNVLALLEGKRGYRELLSPTEEIFQTVRDDHLRPGGYYALLLAGVDVPNESKVGNEVGDPILEHVVKHNLQSDYEVTDAAGASWGVAHSKGVVERPAVYNMPWQRFIGLGLGHEIGSHLLERVNGLRGPLELAASGLDRTEAGNEGRAVTREQVVYGSFDEFAALVRWRDILRRDIAIAYGCGVGEDRPQTSSEVYSFVNTIDKMYQTKLRPDAPQEVIDEKSQAKTDDLLLRVLKATDGEGGAYLKDKVYLEGHVATWLTVALHGAERISEGDLGKFDINNPRHIVLLQKYGLLPDTKS